MLKQSLRKLSKNISRKNLFNFIEGYIKKIENETGELNEIKVLNVGSGGDIEKYLRSIFKFVYSVDIEEKRKPNQVIDICDKKQLSKLMFEPKLIK